MLHSSYFDGSDYAGNVSVSSYVSLEKTIWKTSNIDTGSDIWGQE